MLLVKKRSIVAHAIKRPAKQDKRDDEMDRFATRPTTKRRCLYVQDKHKHGAMKVVKTFFSSYPIYIYANPYMPVFSVFL